MDYMTDDEYPEETARPSSTIGVLAQWSLPTFGIFLFFIVKGIVSQNAGIGLMLYFFACSMLTLYGNVYDGLCLGLVASVFVVAFFFRLIEVSTGIITPNMGRNFTRGPLKIVLGLSIAHTILLLVAVMDLSDPGGQCFFRPDSNTPEDQKTCAPPPDYVV